MVIIYDSMAVNEKKSLFLVCREDYPYPVQLIFCQEEGAPLEGEPIPPDLLGAEHDHVRKIAIRDAFRFGESTLNFCGEDHLVWALPIMDNAHIIGGVVAHISEADFYSPTTNQPMFDFRQAREDLLRLLERENLTNGAALKLNRQFYRSEAQKAKAITFSKGLRPHNHIRQLYMGEEPALFAAIRSRDFSHAREIINRVLLAIYQAAEEDFELVKCFLLELIISISRTAVEGGANPQQLLGKNYRAMAEISTVDDMEELVMWFVNTIEQMLMAIAKVGKGPSSLVKNALEYMNNNLQHDISRSDVAEHVSCSPNHLSYVIRSETGLSYSEMLNRLRIDLAAEKLTSTESDLSQIAYDVGFADQSYFTKVFKKYRNKTPLAFRKEKTSPV